MEDTLFSIVNTYALCAWLLILIFPHADFLQPVVRIGGIMILALAYTVVIPMGFSADSGADFSSLAGLRAGFSSDWALLAGWIHYLAFDLFVGLWIHEQSRQIALPRIFRWLCLLCTFMAGPFGLVLFYLFRFIKLRTAS